MLQTVQMKKLAKTSDCQAAKTALPQPCWNENKPAGQQANLQRKELSKLPNELNSNSWSAKQHYFRFPQQFASDLTSQNAALDPSQPRSPAKSPRSSSKLRPTLQQIPHNPPANCSPSLKQSTPVSPANRSRATVNYFRSPQPNWTRSSSKLLPAHRKRPPPPNKVEMRFTKRNKVP